MLPCDRLKNHQRKNVMGWVRNVKWSNNRNGMRFMRIHCRDATEFSIWLLKRVNYCFFLLAAIRLCKPAYRLFVHVWLHRTSNDYRQTIFHFRNEAMSIIISFFLFFFFSSFAINNQHLLQVLRPSYPTIHPYPTSYFLCDGCVPVVEGSTELITLPVAADTNLPLWEVDNSGCVSAKDELYFEAYSYKASSRSFSWLSSPLSPETVVAFDCLELLITSVSSALYFVCPVLGQCSFSSQWVAAFVGYSRNLLKRDSYYISWGPASLRLSMPSKAFGAADYYWVSLEVFGSKLCDSSVHSNLITVGRIEVYH